MPPPPQFFPFFPHTTLFRSPLAGSDQPEPCRRSGRILADVARGDRKSTRLNSSHLVNLVCRLLLEKKKLRTRVRGQKEASTAFLGCVDLAEGLRLVFFFNYTGTTEIYPLPPHDALPI